MKLTKILGLAAIAAVAAMAFAGSASAANEHPLIVLCKAQELLLCAQGNILELKGTLKGLQIGTGKLEGTINQSCTGGEIQGKTGAMQDNIGGTEESKLLGETTKLTFTGCEPCKKITTTPPFTTNVRMKSPAAAWELEGAGNATFEECTFGVKCKFKATELKPAPTIEMNETEAIVNTNKAEMQLEEGSAFFCGSTGKWNAKYKLELDLGNGTVHPAFPSLCKTGVAEDKLCIK